MKQCYFLVKCLLILGISGCITTNTSPYSAKVNQSKAHDTHIRLGLTYLQSDNREASRRHFQKALTLQPDSPAAHNGLALLYQLTGEMDLAEAAFKRAIKKDAGFTEAKVNYGHFLYTVSRYHEAYALFQDSVLDLTYEHRAHVLAYLGQTSLKLGNTIKAKSSFVHAININNNLTLPMIELSELYFAEKDYAQSKKYLDRYVSIEGRTARSLWLGIRIERIFGNKDKEASYIIALKNLHQYSKEYLAYRKQLQHDK